MDINAPKTLEEKLAIRIRELRHAAGITQAKLAYVLNITQSTMSKLESGQEYVGITYYKNIAEFFGIELVYLLSEDFSVPEKHLLEEDIAQYAENRGGTLKEFLSKKPGTAGMIDQLLETGFMDEPKTVKEIIAECKEKNGIQLIASRVSNILKSRATQNKVRIILTEKSGIHQYQKNPA